MEDKKEKKYNPVTEFFVKLGAKCAFGIANVVVRILYPPKITWVNKQNTKEALKKGCVIYSNHTSHVDGLYMPRILSRYKVNTFVARDWYDKKKINWLFRNLPYIPMNRKDMDTEWLDLGVAKINDKKPIYIFPEGKTSKGEMGEFKPGFLMLAKRTKAGVVPICIDGNFKKFHRIHIIIGEEMKLDLEEEGRPSIVLKKYSAQCKEKILELKERYGHVNA